MLFRDLTDPILVSFLKAYLDSYRWAGALDRHPEIRDAAILDDDAYQDGARLRTAMEMVYSADHTYNTDITDYDMVAEELNTKYGQGLVLTSREGPDLGLRGFRIAAFTSMTDTTFHDDGTRTQFTVDLAEQARLRDLADLAEDREDPR